MTPVSDSLATSETETGVNYVFVIHSFSRHGNTKYINLQKVFSRWLKDSTLEDLTKKL